jgi:hypothetical protein
MAWRYSALRCLRCGKAAARLFAALTYLCEYPLLFRLFARACCQLVEEAVNS